MRVAALLNVRVDKEGMQFSPQKEEEEEEEGMQLRRAWRGTTTIMALDDRHAHATLCASRVFSLYLGLSHVFVGFLPTKFFKILCAHTTNYFLCSSHLQIHRVICRNYI